MQHINHTTLQTFRSIGDPLADSFISHLVKERGVNALHESMAFLSDFKQISETPTFLFEWFNTFKYPEEINKKEMFRACEFFRKNQLNIGLLLSCYALPYCYLGAHGAKVLVQTKRIKSDTYNRLKETGQFLSSILDFENWENGKAQISLLKVRLLHAAVRFFVLSSKRWNMSWGHPINQEDMAGTNLAFSLIVLRGMHKMGYYPDQVSERAYIYFWSVAGYMLGVHPNLLTHSLKEALYLDKLIAQRQFAGSSEGVELTHALIRSFEKLTTANVEIEVLLGQMNFLLGKTYASYLKIPKSTISENLVKSYNYSGSFVLNIFN